MYHRLSQFIPSLSEIAIGALCIILAIGVPITSIVLYRKRQSKNKLWRFINILFGLFLLALIINLCLALLFPS